MARFGLKRPPGVALIDDAAQTPKAPSAVTPSASDGSGQGLLVRELGWSEADTTDTHFRLRPFEEDWDAPGMDAYDDL